MMRSVHDPATLDHKKNKTFELMIFDIVFRVINCFWSDVMNAFCVALRREHDRTVSVPAIVSRRESRDNP